MAKIIRTFFINAVAFMTVVFAPALAISDYTPELISVVQADEVKVSPHELECMTLTIYFESNNQSKAGQIAVARVVMNRVNDSRFPNTVCEVVHKGPIRESWKTLQDLTLPDDERVYYPTRNKCHFSWYCDGKKDDVKNKETNIAYQKSYGVAVEVMAYNKYNGIVEGATHYHADYVNPSWRKTKTLVTKIDDHIFYRWEY